jgi:hypothetical protein
MFVGRSLDRWLGRVPELAAIIAAIGFGAPVYSQRSPPPPVRASAAHAPMVRAAPPRTQPPVHQQQVQQQLPPQQPRPPQQQPTAPTDVPKEFGGERPGGGAPINGGQPGPVAGVNGGAGEDAGLASATRVHAQVPHPPSTRRWPLPQGATEGDRPPPGQCRVWLGGVPASRQPAPTSCGQAAKMRTPGSTLIFGDDKP